MTETLEQPLPSSSTDRSTPNARSADHTALPEVIHVRPWIDPVVDDSGHDPRSRYVERFWLGVLGPTATWLLRRLVAGLDRSPDGYEVDLVDTARAMGLSYTSGRSSPFAKALQRCVMFGLAHQTSDGLAIRRRVPTVAHRHLRRLPAAVQTEHETWSQTVTLDELSRAHQLAIAMIDAGDDPDAIEHQLIAVGVGNATAADVADNLARL
ncbi:hypothetical protein [Ilumatobacter coccineus]|nr:hypothetical protein [Ilumatobacter coccineus]